MSTKYGALALVLMASWLSACSDEESDTGTIRFQMTDAPFPVGECVTQAKIIVKEVSIKTDGGDEAFLAVPLKDSAETVELDLLQLRNGLMDQLALVELPTGTYKEVRLVIEDATLVYQDGSTSQFKIPSGTSSGLKIKIKPDLVLAAGQTVELVLDMDLTRSFKVSGKDLTCDELKETKASKVKFMPVVKAINRASWGAVFGLVKDAAGAAVANAEVAAYPAGSVVTEALEPAAVTLSSPAGLAGSPLGTYALLLQPGSYDLYVRAQGADAQVAALQAIAVEANKVLADQAITLP